LSCHSAQLCCLALMFMVYCLLLPGFCFNIVDWPLNLIDTGHLLMAAKKIQAFWGEEADD
jgi:hypothetical protein